MEYSWTYFSHCIKYSNHNLFPLWSIIYFYYLQVFLSSLMLFIPFSSDAFLCVSFVKKWIRSNHANTSQVLFQMFRKFKWMLEFYRSYNLHFYKFASRFASLCALFFSSDVLLQHFNVLYRYQNAFLPILLKHVRTLGKCKTLFCFCFYRFSVRYILILKGRAILSIWCVNCSSKILWSHESRFLFRSFPRFLVQMTQAFLSLLSVPDTIHSSLYTFRFSFIRFALFDAIFLIFSFSLCSVFFLWFVKIFRHCGRKIRKRVSSKFLLRAASVIWHTATLHFARNKLGFVVDFIFILSVQWT